MTTPPALILNVDDNDGARYAKTRMLMRAGFDVIEAATGNMALEQVRERNPDLVLLDVKLPDINGLEVCRRIKRDPLTATTLVLQTSAAAVHTVDKVRALEGGADSYLTEPIEPAELIANVRALLRLRRAENALREADRRKDQFLAMLAHELRNPLAPIRHAVEIMDPSKSLPADMLDAARMIVSRQVTHLSRLVDDLLDVSRITQGKITLKHEAVDLATAVSAAIETVRPALDKKHHTLRVELPSTPSTLLGDSVRIAQVIGNLLSNASKYTPDGGTIELSAELRTGEIAIHVRDNGIGIDAGILPHIFELFVQSESSLERSEGGLGIGLPLARTLVELHGGRIEAHSAGIGKGSEFIAIWPQSLVPASRSTMKKEAVVAQEIQTRRVLLVDDSVDAASAMSLLLETLGHEVRVAHDGFAALEAVGEFAPEVVILDIGLPGMDGFQIARALRERADTAGALLIALTGYGQASDRQHSHEAGFDRHFVKPVSFDDIERVIAQAGAPGLPRNLTPLTRA
jgi:signal transduction histidine kinase